MRIGVKARSGCEVMNSKAEYNRAKLPRIVIELPQETKPASNEDATTLKKVRANQVDTLQWGIMSEVKVWPVGNL